MLQIRLFGNVELFNDDKPLQEFSTQKSKAIFVMLVLWPDRVFSRERIVNQFWSELTESKGKKCLSSDLWRVKEVIKSGGLDPDEYISVRDQGIGFNTNAGHWLDVQTFEDSLCPIVDMRPRELRENQIKNLEKSIELYRGDLVDDMYEDWIFMQREALRAEYVRAIEMLMNYHASQLNLPDAIIYGQKLLTLDPLLEHIHREMMICYYRLGNRSAALKQYARCEETLWSELKIEPMVETRDLYQKLLSAAPTQQLIGYRSADVGYTIKHNVLNQRSTEDCVKLAMEQLDTAYEYLRDAKQQLNNIHNK